MASSVIQYVVLGLGGALGTMLRFGLGTFVDQRTEGTFPWGTILVNISGCFIIGFINAITAPEARLLVPTLLRQFIMIGILGGYTTFSSFSLQTLNLAQQQEWPAAIGNVLISVVSCLLSVWLGATLANWLNQIR